MRLTELADEVAADADLRARIAQNPEAELRRAAGGPAYKSDVWVYRGVVIFLGLTIILAAAGAVLLAVLEAEVPELLIAIGSAAVGALAGLLAPTAATTE